MSDNDKKRYYWLKLKKDFFQRHDIRIIESMPNGKDYVLFYLKLMCESTSHQGELRFSEYVPYSEEMLATITGTNVDIVRQAIKLFEGLKLIEILDDGTIFLNEVQKLIGSETGKAERMRDYRERLKIGNATSLPQCSLDIDIEKDIDIYDDDYKKIIGQLELIHKRNVEAKLYSEQRAYELSQDIAKAYEITGICLSTKRLEDIILKIADGGISNELGYIIECFKGESQ